MLRAKLDRTLAKVLLCHRDGWFCSAQLRLSFLRLLAAWPQCGMTARAQHSNKLRRAPQLRLVAKVTAATALRLKAFASRAVFKKAGQLGSHNMIFTFEV